VSQLDGRRSTGAAHPLLPAEVQRSYRERGYWEDLTLAHFVARWAQTTPDRVAVVGDVELTYAQLWDRARRVAGRLLADGVEPGQALLAVLPNSWQGVLMELAAVIGGWVFVPRAPTIAPRSVEQLLEQFDIGGVVLTGETLGQDEWQKLWAERLHVPGRVAMLQGEGPEFVDVPVLEAVSLEGPIASPAAVGGGDPCLVLSTGGTTGSPKSIVHCANALVYANRKLAEALEFTERDVYVSIAPYGHAGGSVFDIYLPLMHGASVLPMGRWRAADAARKIARYKGTVLMTMGTHVYDLLGVEGAADLLASMRVVTSGAAGADLFLQAERTLRVPIVRIYGCGEVPGHAVGRLAEPAEYRLSHDGIPFAGMDGRLVDPLTAAEVPQGTPGTYQCRGPNLFLGYAGRPELTASVVGEDGFYDTGDTMFLDSNGYLTWSGRTKDVIRRGGLQIDPLALERLLSLHPSVESVVVVGEPHPRLGETATAVAVSRAGTACPSLDELCRFLAEQGVPKQELPERLVLVDELPRTDVGKFHRAEVRRLVTTGPDRPVRE
jgi:acyl-coenzyme A synthetase/AMP-(fatty) acid ligase